MKLWKRASGALKDQKSLLKASLTYRSALRNPNIEKAVIRATSHDESRVDYQSAQRIFAWVRISDDCLYRVLWALFGRMKRTHNWAVALKGIMLLHGIFCCKVSGIQDIGRLPYDVLNLKDMGIKHRKFSGLNAFIHAYYAYLDAKSRFIFLHSQEQRKLAVLSLEETNDEEKQNSTIHDFVWLQHLQGLLDTLLETQPNSSQMVSVLILEAMDCIVIELYDIYSRISNGIGNVLARITSCGENEAKMALSIMQKAKIQDDEVSGFFKFCKDIGVGNAFECPKMEEIPEEVFQELEQRIKRDPEQLKTDQSPEEQMKPVIVVEQHNVMKTCDHNNSMSSLKPVVITDNWEVFDEEQNQSINLIDTFSAPVKNNVRDGPLPDLISF
ncbi:putative clathrin assembly protein At1g25240 [Rutidosis leptorrhynchoides]|uniref:putative clathrin assembly protein At1g25240 n=1 Tax=Rutidosis leptorrhynchoides TaxID=125765 RepID=UPI003A9A4066